MGLWLASFGDSIELFQFWSGRLIAVDIRVSVVVSLAGQSTAKSQPGSKSGVLQFLCFHWLDAQAGGDDLRNRWAGQA